MADETVRIERMTLSVSGLSADEATGFGREVARYLAKGVDKGAPNRSLGAVDLEVATETDMNERRALTEQVAQGMLNGMGK